MVNSRLLEGFRRRPVAAPAGPDDDDVPAHGFQEALVFEVATAVTAQRVS